MRDSHRMSRASLLFVCAFKSDSRFRWSSLVFKPQKLIRKSIVCEILQLTRIDEDFHRSNCLQILELKTCYSNDRGSAGSFSEKFCSWKVHFSLLIGSIQRRSNGELRILNLVSLQVHMNCRCMVTLVCVQEVLVMRNCIVKFVNRTMCARYA